MNLFISLESGKDLGILKKKKNWESFLNVGPKLPRTVLVMFCTFSNVPTPTYMNSYGFFMDSIPYHSNNFIFFSKRK